MNSGWIFIQEIQCQESEMKSKTDFLRRQWAQRLKAGSFQQYKSLHTKPEQKSEPYSRRPFPRNFRVFVQTPSKEVVENFTRIIRSIQTSCHVSGAARKIFLEHFHQFWSCLREIYALHPSITLSLTAVCHQQRLSFKPNFRFGERRIAAKFLFENHHKSSSFDT